MVFITRLHYVPLYNMYLPHDPVTSFLILVTDIKLCYFQCVCIRDMLISIINIGVHFTSLFRNMSGPEMSSTISVVVYIHADGRETNSGLQT